VTSQLTKWDPEAAAVTAWMEQTRGLVAPDPPGEGDLVPNGTGWLVGLGGPGRRTHPRLSRWIGGVGGLAAMGGAWMHLFRLPDSVPLFLAVSVAPVLVILAGYELSVWRAVRRWLPPRAAGRRLAELVTGTPVRLTGVVASQPTVPSLFRGIPAVLFRNRVAGADETRGIDFDLDLDDGQRLRVSVRNALLLDRPRRTREPLACGPISIEATPGGARRLQPAPPSGPGWWSRFLSLFRRESHVGPGDRVEVWGILDHEPVPQAGLTPDRRLPSRFVLRAGNKRPVIVRGSR
jgi:hypothetical protein